MAWLWTLPAVAGSTGSVKLRSKPSRAAVTVSVNSAAALEGFLHATPAILLNADLHCHSVVSDGTLTPEALAERARANGVELWALTDHDEIGGQHRAAAAARAVGMKYLTGTEISVTFADLTVHIVGLGFDPDHPALVQGLRRTRGGREERAREMADGLAKVGIHGAFEGALQYVGNPDLISRTHFARFLVDSGRCTDTHAVFRQYLTTGKPGYVPHQWARLGDAVRWITAAGKVVADWNPDGPYMRATPKTLTSHKVAQINHYMLRSEETFSLKYRTPSPVALRNRYTRWYFKRANSGEEMDASAFRYADAFAAMQGQAMALPDVARLHHLCCADHIGLICDKAGKRAADDPRYQDHLAAAEALAPAAG